MRLLAVAIILGLLASPSAAQDPMRGPWMVFFDWGKPELRSDDAVTLDQVAAAYRVAPAGHLRLTGHTDRSGTAAVNRAAGLRRAESIRVELEKRGIPRNAMTIATLGEERPLVPTEDGVREVQNRRVVIALEG
jgi:outer membrane protein OmpA-like peptidoglycan-associated protein